MELNQVKEKAKVLKETIESALLVFRTQTGYTPQVEIETKKRNTNDGSFVNQSVTIVLTIQ